MHNADVQDEAQWQKIVLQDAVSVNGVKGRVKFIGETKFAKGIWYGIELNKPLGKNDGSVNGIRYFFIEEKKIATNGPCYGLFCKRNALQLCNPANNEPSLLKNDNTLHDKVKALQVQCESLTSELDVSEQQKDQLRAAIENLSINESDLLSQTSGLNKLVEALKVENDDMKIRLEEFAISTDPSNNTVAQNFDVKKLWDNNRLLQGLLEQTTASYNEAMKVQEDLLEENTQLLEENTALSKKISDLTLRLEQTNVTISDLAQQLEAQSKSSNIVDKLTNDNILLTNDIKSLKNQIKEVCAKEKLNEHLRITYEELEQELNLQLSNLQSALENKQILANNYIEENARLKSMLELSESQATDKCQGLELKVNTLNEELYQNKLLKEFYKVCEPFAQPHLGVLSSQLQYLADVMEGENAACSSFMVIQNYTVLKILSCICHALHTYSMKKAPTCLETTAQDFEFNNIQISMWLSEFLQRRFSSKQEIASSICKFLKENEFLDKDVTLILKILHPIFETIIPKLLAAFKGSNDISNEDVLFFISSLYERSFSVTAKIGELIEEQEVLKQNKNLLLNPACNSTLSSILETFFSNPVFLQQESSCQHSLEMLKYYFLEIESFLESKIIFTEYASQTSVSSESVQKSGEDKFLTLPLSDHFSEENSHLKEILLQKQNNLTELETKIKIISARDSERKYLEENIKSLQKDLNKKKKEIHSKSEMLHTLKEENANLLSSLKNMELGLYQIESNSNLNRMHLSRKEVDRINLVSEIMELKETVKRQVKDKKQVGIDFSWLDELLIVEKKQSSEGHLYRGLNTLGGEMADFVNNSRIIDLGFYESFKENELSNETDDSYVTYLKHKRKNILFKFQNTVTYGE